MVFIILQVYVTDSWIIKAGTYSIDIVHQSNCVVSLHGSEEYTLSEESPHGVQMLQIDVRPVDKSQRPFVIRSVLHTEIQSNVLC